MNSVNGKKGKSSRFVVRNSLLIDLFENSHIRTVYHLFIATFIGLFVNTAAYDLLKNGEVKLGLNVIKACFANVHIALIVWTGYFLSTCFIYFLFKIWALSRRNLGKQLVPLWDWFWMILLGSYYITSFQIASKVVSGHSLPIASAAVVLCEQTRFLMKIHSFVRTSAPKVLSPSGLVPSFSSFFYFLFVPTLIFQEQYPRTDKVRYHFVMFRFLESVAALFYMSFVFDRFLNPTIHDFGLRKFTINEVVLTILENTTTGIIFLLPVFFLVLHSWQNLFAEITRFGDRLFYSDWWTCTDFSGYFRKWNIIVQDWLFLYVYKDFYLHVFKGSTGMAKLSVFVVSAVVHEWILTYALGYFFPLLFLMFLVFGSILQYVAPPKTAVFNVLFWYGLGVGMGILVTLYGIEYYARLNVPVVDSTLKSVIVPRFLTCDCITFA